MQHITNDDAIGLIRALVANKSLSEHELVGYLSTAAKATLAVDKILSGEAAGADAGESDPEPRVVAHKMIIDIGGLIGLLDEREARQRAELARLNAKRVD